MTAIETLKASAATKSTDVLLGALLILDAKGSLDETERMVSAAMADVIEERHNLSAALDAIFDETFTGTYAEALMLALAGVAA